MPGPSVFPSGEPGVSGDFWGSQEGCQKNLLLSTSLVVQGPVHHQLPEFTQTHVHRVSDAIQPSQANLENSAVATGLEKVSFHSNPKDRQCQRMLKLLHNCTGIHCRTQETRDALSAGSAADVSGREPCLE